MLASWGKGLVDSDLFSLMLNTGLSIEQSRDLSTDHKPGVNRSALLHSNAAHCSCEQQADKLAEQTFARRIQSPGWTLWLSSLLVWGRRSWLQCKHSILYHGQAVHGWQAAGLAPCLLPEKCCSFLMRSQIEAVIKSNDHNHLAPSLPVLSDPSNNTFSMSLVSKP